MSEISELILLLNKQHQEQMSVLRDEHREQNKQHQEQNKQHQEQMAVLRDEHREQNKQYQEQNKQHQEQMTMLQEQLKIMWRVMRQLCGMSENYAACIQLCGEFPTLFESTLGCLKDFSLDIRFKPEAKPIFKNRF